MPSSVAHKAGVMGWPIGHSLSPRLHGFWLRHYGIKGSYEAFETKPEDLPSALRGLKANGLAGVNLTIPHKVAACKLVDALDPAAGRIGAVNLVTVDAQSRVLGSNTDAYGFSQNLSASGFKPAGGAAFVLGAGGACRAVLVALEDLGFTEIRIANRTKERAESLAREFSTPQTKIMVVPWKTAPQDISGIDLLVNTTSLGMAGQPPLAFSLETLPSSAFVADIVYAPVETCLLQKAKQRGYRTIDGLGMLLHQARPSFTAFFGREPEVTEELRRFVLSGGKDA
jgi:shikimate dehydrogenase